MSGQHFGKSGFTAADISCDSYVHMIIFDNIHKINNSFLYFCIIR